MLSESTILILTSLMDHHVYHFKTLLNCATCYKKLQILDLLHVLRYHECSKAGIVCVL